jgi:hypothetical protein
MGPQVALSLLNCMTCQRAVGRETVGPVVDREMVRTTSKGQKVGEDRDFDMWFRHLLGLHTYSSTSNIYFLMRAFRMRD